MKPNRTKLLGLDAPTLTPMTTAPFSAISSPAQDALIEKILRHTGQWDPPWLRKRRARGPPPACFSSSPEGRRPDLPDPDFDFSDRQPTDEDYSVDAPAPDDFA